MNTKEFELVDVVAKKKPNGAVDCILTYWITDNRLDGCGVVPVQAIFPRTAMKSRAALEFAFSKVNALFEGIMGRQLTPEERRIITLDFRDNAQDALKRAKVKDE
jgi:hypothetical protein